MSVFKRWNGTQWETIGPGISSARFDNINNMIAPEFDPKNTYDIGDYVVQSDKLYRCIYRIGTPQAWNGENWREVKLGQDVTELRNNVVTVSNIQPTSENNRIWVKPDNNDMKIPLVEDVMMLPSSDNYGENGQYPRSTGSGIEWTDYGLPSDQQTENAINAWLNVHPEATTTVQDGSLTEAKFHDDLKIKTIKDYVTPQMYGAIGDGVTDDTLKIQNMLSDLNNNDIVIFPVGVYKISDTIVIDKSLNIYCFGNIVYSGTRNKPAILITSKYTSPQRKVKECTLVFKDIVDVDSYSDLHYDGGWHGWLDDNYAAIELRDVSYCNIKFQTIANFTTGVFISSEGAMGNSDNMIDGEHILNCKNGILFKTIGTSGWNNCHTIKNIDIEFGYRSNPFWESSKNIMAYGIKQSDDCNNYGISYLKIQNLFFEVSRDLFTGFYFILCSNSTFEHCDIEIANVNKFAVFNMKYTSDRPTTTLEFSSNNIFYDCEVMGGSKTIYYENIGKITCSLKEIAKHNDDQIIDIYSDFDFSNAVLPIGSHSAIKGYGSIEIDSNKNIETAIRPRTNYYRDTNYPLKNGIYISAAYPMCIIIDVNYLDTYLIQISTFDIGANYYKGTFGIKCYDENGDLLIQDGLNKMIGGYLSYNFNYNVYLSISGSLTNREFSIVDNRVKKIVVLFEYAISGFSIKKYDSTGNVRRLSNTLSPFYGYGKVFMSDQAPNNVSVDTISNIPGQKIYDTRDNKFGNYWELTKVNDNFSWKYIDVNA